jgi:hypothetical protein
MLYGPALLWACFSYISFALSPVMWKADVFTLHTIRYQPEDPRSLNNVIITWGLESLRAGGFGHWTDISWVDSLASLKIDKGVGQLCGALSETYKMSSSWQTGTQK